MIDWGSGDFEHPFGEGDNPWDFPSKVWLIWAHSTECDWDVVGIWLSESRAKYHAASLAAGRAHPRGNYEEPTEMKFSLQQIKQVAVQAELGGP